MKDISQITTYQSGVLQSSAHRQSMRVKTEYLSRYNLTAMQWFVIGHVYDADEIGLRLNDLMKILDTTMPFITTLVNGLESRKIIQKSADASDSRVKVATLSPSYRHTVEEIEAGLREELRDELYVRDKITRQELETYLKVLSKMTQQED
jgi:DNA-binding MarR family transcriptional regulator